MAVLIPISGGTNITGLLLVADTSSEWTGRTEIYEVLDQQKPSYRIAPATRSGSFRLLLRDAATRAAVVTTLATGKAHRLLRDGFTTQTDWCVQGVSLIPQVDVDAWVAETFTESWVDDGVDEAVYLEVRWREVSATPPVVLPS